MTDSVQLQGLPSPTRLPFVTLVGLVAGLVLSTIAVVWLSAATTLALYQVCQAFALPFTAIFEEAGWDRVLRRVMMVWAVLLVGLYLKRAGWQGWRDCGFTTRDPEQAWRSAWGDMVCGIGLGLGTLGFVSVITVVLGVHRWYPNDSGWGAVARCAGLLASGVAVAVFEETVCRGILFRVLSRRWNVWPTAILVSVMFAAAHFISPDPGAIRIETFFSTTVNITMSAFESPLAGPRFPLHFFNLVLLGVVLCALVMRTGTIWLAVGAHASWVWIIKFHSFLTMYYPASPFVPWIGKRNDFMDSGLATLLLGSLLVWAVAQSARTGAPLRIRDRVWQVNPDAQKQAHDWLWHWDRRVKTSIDRVLKAYPGCRVTEWEGGVLKTYTPRTVWHALRLAFKPARVRRAFLMGRELLRCDLPTPCPLAWNVKRRWSLQGREDCLLSEYVAGTEPLSDWLRRTGAENPARVRVLAAYGRLMAMFHAHRFSNRDFKHENVLCNTVEPWTLWVVDLDGVRACGFLSRRRAIRDLGLVGRCLASLGCTQLGDVRAFFEAYNQGVPARLRRTGFP